MTGLAQIYNAARHEPEVKLRYDVEYVCRQSFWFEVKIALRQICNIMANFAE